MTGLTGSSPAVRHINLVSNRFVPIGNLGLFLHLDRRIPAGMFLLKSMLTCVQAQE